jgi:hypothetical protein
MATLATEGVRGFKIALEDMAATSAQVDAIIQRTLQGGPAATGQTPQGQAPRASAPGVATGTEQTAARAKQALTLFDELKTKLGQINTQAGVTPTLVNKTREAMKQLQDTAENVRKLFPGEAPAEVTAGLRDVERQYKALQDQEEAGRSARRAGTQASRQEAREERQAEREAEQLAAERRQQAHARGQLVLQQIDHLAELAAAQEREREELTLTEDAYEQLTLVRALEAAGISTQAGSYGELLLKRRDELQVLRESAKVREELKKYEEQQISTLERLTKTTDQLRYAETRRLFERAQIAEDDPRLVAAMERDIDISLRESLKAPLESFDKAKDATTDFSTFFADTILNATDIAKRGFAGFADSVIQSLQRIALQQFIRPALEQFIGAGLQSLSFLGGGTASAGEAASAVAGFASRFGDGALPRQHGGPVEAGQPYVVGERGRELFVPRQSGTIVPGAMASPTVIVNISTPDASSFLRSRGEVQQSMARAVQAAMRFA